MPQFSEKSKRILATCHPKLIAVCNTAIMKFDFSVISGHRVEQEQNTAFRSGNSHLTFPHSKHNKEPSMAVDLYPYPIDMEALDKLMEGIVSEEGIHSLKRFIALSAYIRGLAQGLDIKIRSGADWDGDFIMNDQKFHDLPHIELIK